MKSFRYLYILGIWVLLTSFFSCKTADIRPSQLGNPAQAQVLLQGMSRHHGIDAWQDIQTYSVLLKDEFYGFLGKMANPFPNNLADIKLSYIPGTFTGRGEFQSGKWQGKVWGIQSWKTYTPDATGKAQFHPKNDKTIEFWIPTYQYFIELPARIQEADVFEYAGERSYQGKAYDLVFATWGQEQPSKDYDQYLLWLERESQQLDRVQYTVRDQGNWVQATLDFSHYQEVGGLRLPMQMDVHVGGPEQEKVLHRMTLSDFQKNPVSKRALMPDAGLGTEGKK